VMVTAPYFVAIIGMAVGTACVALSKNRSVVNVTKRIAALPFFVAACVSLYFGSGMLLLVPGYPGESYFAKERFIYGVLPALLSIGLLMVTAAIWVRSGISMTFRDAASLAFALAVTTIILFWVGLILWTLFSNH
jgi:hypothetical protein